MKKLLIVAIVGSLIWYAQSQKVSDSVPQPIDTRNLEPEQEIAKAFSPEPSGNFACDGRTRCSEMRSCEEAEFFLKRCPGVKMDGDRDGVPCEDQHC